MAYSDVRHVRDRYSESCQPEVISTGSRAKVDETDLASEDVGPNDKDA